jgi:hypothetical protein
MQRTCDTTTMQLLRGAVGRRLTVLAVRRYWDCLLGYSEAIARFFDGPELRFELEPTTVGPSFEVFVARIRAVVPDADRGDPAEWDRIELGDFELVQAFLLRREEWVEPLPEGPVTQPGGRGHRHHAGPLGGRGAPGGGVEVDAGICFLSTNGAELSMEADFRENFQLRYQRAQVPLPTSSRIPVVG